MSSFWPIATPTAPARLLRTKRHSVGLLRAGACGSRCRRNQAPIGRMCSPAAAVCKSLRPTMPRDGAARVRAGIAAAEEFGWAEPDMAVLRLHRRQPPVLPLAVFGPEWRH